MRVSAQQEATDFLREQILSGKYPAGARLKADRIAQSLGLSRMPVREAIVQLHAEGLVAMRPNRSAVVISLTPEDVVELFQIRAVLEGLAARLATPRLGKDQLAELDTLAARMERAADNPDLWLQRHEELHHYLCELSNAPRLTTQIRNCRAAVIPYIRMYINVYHQVEVQGAEHRVLLSIAERCNADLLEVAMRDHVLSTAASIADFMRKQIQQTAPSGNAKTRFVAEDVK